MEWKAGDRFSFATKTTGFVPFSLCLIISYKSVVNEDKLQKKDISTSFGVVFNWTKRSNCFDVSIL